MCVLISRLGRRFLTLAVIASLCNSCAPLVARIPTVSDEKVAQFVRATGLGIVDVSEQRNHGTAYQFYLAGFTRPDILGLSTGNHQIYISYELARRAYRDDSYRWLLRQTLAHEIAHDVLGRSGGPEKGEGHSGLANRITGSDLGLSGWFSLRLYSRSAELAADRKAMEYWSKLGWDCSHWVALFADFLAQGYEGDVDHPTKERLEQARKICAAPAA
jgi:hypothetical protein